MSIQSQRLRIIGGKYRSRILNFAEAEGLRPTPDRVRETIFNWLQPIMEGAVCVDLFAGSGALGLEAVSRGAAKVIMLEPNHQAAMQIREHIETLQIENADVVEQPAEPYIQRGGDGFDIAFIDPPYRSGLLYPTCHMLEDFHRLKPHARIYLESEAKLEEGKLPANWVLVRQKQAGQVFYHLATRG